MTARHLPCTRHAPPVHPHRTLWLGIVNLCAIGWLAACAPAPTDDPQLLRNPTVPIGAISRFDAARFDGKWRVERAGAGEWALAGFEIANDQWQERSETEATRDARVTQLGRGILELAYDDTTTRNLWVVWIDPDHNTAALGNPDGQFGFVVTRVGKRRVDQIRAAEQVLDFNGYRTATWARIQ